MILWSSVQVYYIVMDVNPPTPLHTHTHPTPTHTHSVGMPTTTPTTSSGTTPTPQQQGGAPNPLLQQMMAQALAGGQVPGGQGPVGQGPVESQQLAQAEVLYQSQLEQLANMGFHNRQANLRGTSCD